jgi:hypothetical protein
MPVGADAQHALVTPVAGEDTTVPLEAPFEASSQTQAALMFAQAEEGVASEGATQRVFVEAVAEAVEETHVERDVARFYATPATPVVVAVAPVSVAVVVISVVVAGVAEAEALFDAPLAPVDGVAFAGPAEFGAAPALSVSSFAAFAAVAFLAVFLIAAVAAPPALAVRISVRVAITAASVLAPFRAVVVLVASFSLLRLCALDGKKKQKQTDECELSASHGSTLHVVGGNRSSRRLAIERPSTTSVPKSGKERSIGKRSRPAACFCPRRCPFSGTLPLVNAHRQALALIEVLRAGIAAEGRQQREAFLVEHRRGVVENPQRQPPGSNSSETCSG